jgi:outer membrane protein assembly factor BamB
VYALDAATGTERWRFLAQGSVSSPAVVGEAVYVTTSAPDSCVYAVDARTGEERWRFEEATDGAVLPMVVGDTLYFGTGVNDTDVYALS